MRSSNNLLDLNISCESFFCRVLNDAYGYNLRNANAESINTPGYDLLDEDNTLLVQVTGDTSWDKVKESLAKVPEEFSGYAMKFHKRCRNDIEGRSAARHKR